MASKQAIPPRFSGVSKMAIRTQRDLLAENTIRDQSHKPASPGKVHNLFDIDAMKSYVTEANLMTALRRLGLDTRCPLVVCNRQGRFTAVFGLHNANVQGDMSFAARHGFMTID